MYQILDATFNTSSHHQLYRQNIVIIITIILIENIV